jgi:hypothetical protein
VGVYNFQYRSRDCALLDVQGPEDEEDPEIEEGVRYCGYQRLLAGFLLLHISAERTCIIFVILIESTLILHPIVIIFTSAYLDYCRRVAFTNQHKKSWKVSKYRKQNRIKQKLHSFLAMSINCTQYGHSQTLKSHIVHHLILGLFIE